MTSRRLGSGTGSATSRGKKHGAGTATARADEGSRDKNAVTHGRRNVKDVRPITPSVTLWTQRRHPWTPSVQCPYIISVWHTPSENSRPTTPSSSYRGYSRSSLSSLNSVTILHPFSYIISHGYFRSQSHEHHFYDGRSLRRSLSYSVYVCTQQLSQSFDWGVVTYTKARAQRIRRAN